MTKLIFCDSNKQIKIFFCLFIFFLFFTFTSFAEEYLTWNSIEKADGYKIYCRPESAQNYFSDAAISNNTSIGINSLVSKFNLEFGKTYFFAVSSYSNDPNIFDNLQSNEKKYHYNPDNPANLSVNTSEDILKTAIVDNLSSSNIVIEGNWSVSDGKNPYGENSFYTTKATDSFTFQSPFAGNIKISLHWTYSYNRCLYVPVKIYDGATLIDTVYINQREKNNSSQWYLLGEYTFGNKPNVVITAKDEPEVLEGNYKYISISADAVKFKQLY
jgi:hypothetical protein